MLAFGIALLKRDHSNCMSDADNFVSHLYKNYGSNILQYSVKERSNVIGCLSAVQICCCILFFLFMISFINID